MPPIDYIARGLALEAIDTAFKDHVCQLFATASMAQGSDTVVDNVMAGYAIAKEARAKIRERIQQEES